MTELGRPIQLPGADTPPGYRVTVWSDAFQGEADWVPRPAGTDITAKGPKLSEQKLGILR
jgi:hypothetical protein